jgi:BCD family chlorophyll transporter-like MFS transporter
MSGGTGLGGMGIVRLGLVQTCLGAIIVLTTSTINRIMVVELALPAMLPGILVALHHAVQMSRPRFGHGSDVGGRTTGWIIGGMFVLALGGIGAARARCSGHDQPRLPRVRAVLRGHRSRRQRRGHLAAGDPGQARGPHRKAAAATIVWIMMIAGFAITAGTAGHFLDPFSPAPGAVTGSVSALAVVVTLLAVFRLEPPRRQCVGVSGSAAGGTRRQRQFRAALREVWQEPRRAAFTIFVFVSMLAYSAQDLILEPFAGTVFGMTPGQSTQLAGMQHGGVLLGMLLVAVPHLLRRNCRAWRCCALDRGRLPGLGAGAGGYRQRGAPTDWPLVTNVFLLGVANGAFAVAAIASMMTLAGRGAARREGLRMGLWGAAQAIAFALGGFLGTVAIDVSRAFIADPALAYGLVFSLEGSCLWSPPHRYAPAAAHLTGTAGAGRRPALAM